VAEVRGDRMRASGAILIGGKSSRFGSDKAFMEFRGRSAAESLTRRLSAVVEDVWLVADRAEKLNIEGAETVVDLIPDCGPLGGLYTALHFSRCDYCFLTACDLPFLEAALVHALWEAREDADVVIPEHDGRVEPTAALYHQRCLPFVREALAAERRNMRSFWDRVQVRRLDVTEIFDAATLTRIFFNVNTPENYRQAMERYELP